MDTGKKPLLPVVRVLRIISVVLGALTLLNASSVRADPLLIEWPSLRSLDESRLARLGLRIVTSRHAQLVTDLPAAPSSVPGHAIDDLPGLVDMGVSQWAERFGVGPEKVATWRVRICLIGEEEPFRLAGLMPAGDRRFPNGLSLGYQTWVRDQPTDYYRRHLVLHEATHSFMQTQLGGCGPGWYMEGIAELCGTHSLGKGGLVLATLPNTREAAPMWGRVRLVRDAVRAGRGLSIDQVRHLDNQRPLEPEQYAWVWALAKLLDTHPRYQTRFRALSKHVTERDFDARFDQAFEADRARLEQEWRLFVATLEYGHDIEREAIRFAAAEPNSLVHPSSLAGNRPITLSSSRGWQSTGIRVDAGVSYPIQPSGRFVVARDPDGTPWPCGPGGVTLTYHRGRPLGELLAAVDAGPDAFLKPVPIGLGADFRPERSGTLYLRVNDKPSQLAENSGELTVPIIPADSAARTGRLRPTP